MSVALGIDTGGTYTDAVLVEYETSRVLAQAKALTTKHDLIIGIRGAIERVLAAQPAEICMVSLSTTLATNAIVEGQGAPVCALLIGYEGNLAPKVDLAHELGTTRFALVPGGHNTSGEEQRTLDIAAAQRAILEHAPHVAAFAVSGYFGTRNPSHELRVKELVRQTTGLPVTCGHELTHRLDALRRATTVTLNARLIPLLYDLIQAVKRALGERGIDAPLMVVKGDGSLMDAGMAIERPIETILSGPAASVVGAQHLAGGGDVIVVDMGGTTTDIAVLSRGVPRLSAEGASVGRWRTMVEAVDVHTVGLGGDSCVWLDTERDLCIGPQRIVPVSLLACEHPEVLETLRTQAARSRKPIASAGQFLLLQREWAHRDGERPSFEEALFAELRRGPCALEQVHTLVQHPELYARYFETLEHQGIIVRSGLTPSDAAHVLGFYNDWNVEAATLASELMAVRLGTQPDALCRQVLARTSERIASEIVVKLLADDGHNGYHDALENPLIARSLRPTGNESLHCTLSITPTLVALGAPVRTYFPGVAELLHGQLSIPEHTEVANAIGAVVGSVVYRIHVLVVPTEDEGGYRVHLPDRVCHLTELPDALHCAETNGREAALDGARRAGAMDIRVQVARHDQSAPVSSEWGDEVYLGTTFEISAVGRPRVATHTMGTPKLATVIE